MRSAHASAAVCCVLTLAAASPAKAADSAAEQRGLMTVLAGWSLGSVAAGIPMCTADSDLVRTAGIQNVAWGAVDGAIAAFALLRTPDDTPDGRASLRRIFLVNAALDVLYVAAGASLVAFAKTDVLRGTGAGILAQGGFLLAFDSAGFYVMR